MKFLINIFFMVAILTALSVHAQHSKKEKEVLQEKATKKMVDGETFIFEPQSASPMKGGARQLSTGYTLTVLMDSVICDLPYFGRTYTASMNPSDAGIKFTSTDFQFDVKDRKKGGWDITLKPNDVRNSIKIYFSVSTKGGTSVRITSSDRQSISFNGYLKERKLK